MDVYWCTQKGATNTSVRGELGRYNGVHRKEPLTHH